MNAEDVAFDGQLEEIKINDGQVNQIDISFTSKSANSENAESFHLIKKRSRKVKNTL